MPAPVPTALDLAVVAGALSRDPVVTTLASGSALYRYEVTVRLDDHTESVPVSWLDPSTPPPLAAGDAVVVVGRVRRRFFRAGGATRAATEIVADAVVPARRRVQARRALERAAAVLDGALAG